MTISARPLHGEHEGFFFFFFFFFFFSSQICALLKSPVMDDTNPGGAEVTFAAGLRSCLSFRGGPGPGASPLVFPLGPQNPERSKVRGAAQQPHGACPESLRPLLLLRENTAGSAGIGRETVTFPCDSRLGGGIGRGGWGREHGFRLQESGCPPGQDARR